MKRSAFIALFLAATLCNVQAFAQFSDSPAVEEQLQEMRFRLNLSEEQLVQMTPILEKSIADRKAILSSYGIDPEAAGGERPGLRKMRAMRKELESVRQNTLKELEPLLSEAQFEEFKALQDERREEMRQRMKEGR